MKEKAPAFQNKATSVHLESTDVSEIQNRVEAAIGSKVIDFQLWADKRSFRIFLKWKGLRTVISLGEDDLFKWFDKSGLNHDDLIARDIIDGISEIAIKKYSECMTM